VLEITGSSRIND